MRPLLTLILLLAAPIGVFCQPAPLSVPDSPPRLSLIQVSVPCARRCRTEVDIKRTYGTSRAIASTPSCMAHRSYFAYPLVPGMALLSQ
jgi:hypothetical protein